MDCANLLDIVLSGGKTIWDYLKDNVLDLNKLSQIATVFMGAATLIVFWWSGGFIFFKGKSRQLRRQCDEISRIVADAFDKDDYDDMLSAVERINSAEIERLKKLYLKSKINKQVSLDSEILEMNELKRVFEQNYKERSKEIGEFKEDVRARRHEEEIETVASTDSDSQDDNSNSLRSFEKKLKDAQEKFKQEEISEYLLEVSFQMSKIRERLLSKLKL